MSLTEYEQYTHEMENLAHTEMRFDENPIICTPYKYVSDKRWNIYADILD